MINCLALLKQTFARRYDFVVCYLNLYQSTLVDSYTENSEYIVPLCDLVTKIHTKAAWTNTMGSTEGSKMKGVMVTYMVSVQVFGESQSYINVNCSVYHAEF